MFFTMPYSPTRAFPSPLARFTFGDNAKATVLAGASLVTPSAAPDRCTFDPCFDADSRHCYQLSANPYLRPHLSGKLSFPPAAH